MNHRYLELDSTFRDRTRWPFPGEFEIPISQTGRKSQSTAVDPVSLGTPVTAWTSNLLDANTSGINVTAVVDSVAGANTVAGSNSYSTFIITSTAGNLQQSLQYYLSLIANDTTLGVKRRITSYIYIGTDSGSVNDRARITVEPAFPDTFADGDTIVINDPTDLSNTSLPLFFVPSGRIGKNSYTNCILYNETLNEYRNITEYDFFTNLLEVDTTSSGGGPVTGWLVTHNYNIRKDQPTILSTVGVGSTTNTIVIVGGPTTDNEINGQFIRIRGLLYGNSLVAPEGEIRRIVSYDGATTTATVVPEFSAIPLVGSFIEVLAFSFDNLNPFVYTGSVVSQQEMVCYEIELLNLVLPNQTLTVGQGNRITFYPYVYVELTNISGASTGIKNVIYSNNPNASRMLFRASVADVPNPIISSFVNINGDGMVQTIKFKPNDNLRFSVRLPNGDIYNTVLNETVSPEPTNIFAQISALFSIKRL
jgi:hypothetical protein